ncbi:MAG: DHH family phosphoesterase [Bacteroidaceae bacterium]|nr:DHH family phosphoesterase [Bacteroidaceae bacterium]
MKRPFYRLPAPIDVNPDPGVEFKTMLKTLNWGDDTCFVYGHKTSDVDAVTSALSYAKLIDAFCQD